MSSKIDSLQENPYKQEIRKHIVSQVLAFSKDKTRHVELLSLPSTSWTFEKQLLLALNESGIGLNIHAAENGYDEKGKPIFPLVKENALKGAMLENIDFDTLVRNWTNYPCSIYQDKSFPFQVVWADYCGNPAEFIGFNQGICNSDYRYAYPHLERFAETVAAAVKRNRPMLYFMTFCCNGRIQGGKDALIKAMGGTNCRTMPAAIRTKISCLLSLRKLVPHITEVLRVVYHGGKRSNMVTLGFAVNFEPSFPSIKLDWMDAYRQAKQTETGDKGEKVEIRVADPIALRKQAFRDLSDKGWTSSDIAAAFNISRMKVGAVLAHHRHPESFKK